MTPQRSTGQIDETKAQGFRDRLVEIYAGAALTLMIDIGHRTGLWEAAANGPATSAELAGRAGLHERHVREWLGSVTSGGIMQYDPSSRTYTLPREHAASLTGDGGANRAVGAPMLTYLGKHVGAVATAFREGGGVPYSQYRPEFTSLMDQNFRRDYNENLIDGYIRIVPGLEDRLESGVSVCDLGCGTGHNMNLLATAYPNSDFIGYDIAVDAIELANSEAREIGLSNVSFEVQDATALPADVQFDLITAFDAIHDQVDSQGALDQAGAHLAPDGVFLMIDIKASSNLEDNMHSPHATRQYAVSTMHCMVVSLAGGGSGLGNMWGEQLALEMLAKAGLTNVQVLDSSNPTNSIYVCRM